MPFRIEQTPEPENIVLEDLDESGETYVVVAHATGNDQLKVESAITSPVFGYEREGIGPIRQQDPPEPYVERAAMVWAVLRECNIEDVDGEPLLREKMDFSAFSDAWSKLPNEARLSIFRAVVKVNPHWGYPIYGGVL